MKLVSILSILIFSSFTFFNKAPQDDYAQLWEEVKKFENDQLPRSAFKLVEQIFAKAKKEEREDQIIKAIIHKYKLSAQFEDWDPADYIIKFEKDVGEVDSPAAQAIYASMLGELYHQYGMHNMGRFSQRTDNKSTSDNQLATASLDEIQNQAIQYYIQSLSYNVADTFGNFRNILNFSDSKVNAIGARSIPEFLLFRAIDHFMNSSGFVTQTDGQFTTQLPSFLGSAEDFIAIDITTNDNADYSALTAMLLQRGLQITRDDKDLFAKLNLKRLDHYYQQSRLEDKSELYLKTLERITAQESEVGKYHAYLRMINHHLNEINKYDPFRESATHAHHGIAAYNLIQRAKSEVRKQDYLNTVEALKNRLLEKSLKLSTEEVVASDLDFPILVQYQNIDKVYLRIIKVGSGDIELFNRQSNEQKKINQLLVNKTIHENSFDLPGTADYNQHAIELPVTGLKYGTYAVVISGTKDFKVDQIHPVAVNFITVSDMSYQHSAGGSNTRIYVTNNMTGNPIGGVEVEVYSRSYDYTQRKSVTELVATLFTDKNGLAEYNEQNRSFSFKLIRGNDILDLDRRHYNRQEHPEQEHRQVHLFTDRKIYRPGQIVHFKGLITQQGSENIPELIPAADAVVLLKDANWQTVDEIEVKSNTYGSIHGSFVLPTGSLPGIFHLESRSGNGYGSVALHVEEYKRPQILATLDTINGAVQLGDSVTITGNASSYSGVALHNATIKYSIERTAYVMPYWQYRIMPYPSTSHWVSQGQVKTSKDGNFKISFNTDKIEGNNTRFFNYTLKVDVIDEGGESLQLQKSFRIGSNPYYLTLDLPESALSGSLEDISYHLVNSDGLTIDTTLIVHIYDLQTPDKIFKDRLWRQPDKYYLNKGEHHERFPNLAYGSEGQMDKWKIKSKVLEEVLSGGRSVTDVFDQLGEGVYRVEVFLQNSAKKLSTRYLSVSDIQSRALPTQHLWTTDLKSVYQPGDELTLKYFSPYTGSNVYIEASSQYRVIQSRWMDESNNDFVIAIDESLRGGFSLNIWMVKNGRIYSESYQVNVPWINKELDIHYHSLRDVTLPGNEEAWKIQINGLDKNERAEVMATMYDASLDQFVKNEWVKSFYPSYSSYIQWHGVGFNLAANYNLKEYIRHTQFQTNMYLQPNLDWFGWSLPYRGGDVIFSNQMGDQAMMLKSRNQLPVAEMEAPEEAKMDLDIPSEKSSSQNSMDIHIRKNLNETVFFYPCKYTEDGRLTLEFTMNEALTKWNFLLLAHTEDLDYVFDKKTITTQKPLMIESNLPRYFREGDTLFVTARISNLTEEQIMASSRLEISEYHTNKSLELQWTEATHADEIQLDPGSSQTVSWKINIPEEFKSAVNCRFIVSSDDNTDAEQKLIPVLTNQKLITEAMLIDVGSDHSETFTFQRMIDLQSSASLRNSSYTIEYTSNPNWLVVKALPSLFDMNENSAIGVINNLYGVYLANQIIQSDKTIAEAVSQWSQDSQGTLSANQELKLSELNDTPWLREANSEIANMRKLALYLDHNYVKNQISNLQYCLRSFQHVNGGFSWLPSGSDNWFVTQYILESIGRLKQVADDDDILDLNTINNALNYTDQRLLEKYNEEKTDDDPSLSPILIHYFYMRSFYLEKTIPNDVYVAFSFYIKQLRKNWHKLNSYQQAVAATAMHRWNEKDLSNEIYHSLTERLVKDENLGYYWNDQAGYYWYNPGIEKQAVMIELFRLKEAGKPTLQGLQLWLLRNKQTNHWDTNKQTVSAIWAFLSGETNWIHNVQPVKVYLPESETVLDTKNSKWPESYYINQWTGDEVNTSLAKIKVDNPNDFEVWGAAYWQYYEDLDQIQPSDNNPLRITKKIYKVSYDKNGEVLVPLSEGPVIEKGQVLRIVLNINTDRPMEFIEIKDMRASGLEPRKTLSEYVWQDGLTYYQTNEDIATKFYIDFLPKGSYRLEYDLSAAFKGNYADGLAEIQCLYAPQFTSHSSGANLIIE